jgi:hypothetical protein
MIGTIRRVVVALDAVSENRAAIDAATRLAARWKCRLHGVFVEDDELLRLAVLPFARQVTLGFGAETLTVVAAERQLRAYAERARGQLAAAARAHGVEWSFETVRGAAGMVSVATTDFLVAGTSTRPIGGHFRVECRWWSVVEPNPASFLLAHRETRAQGAVVCVLRSRGPASERALDAAAQLADNDGGRLTVICPPELAAEPGFTEWLSQRLVGHAIRTEVELLPAEPAAQIRHIVELDCRLVAIESSADQAQPGRLRDIVARVSCDVLVVR